MSTKLARYRPLFRSPTIRSRWCKLQPEIQLAQLVIELAGLANGRTFLHLVTRTLQRALSEPRWVGAEAVGAPRRDRGSIPCLVLSFSLTRASLSPVSYINQNVVSLILQTQAFGPICFFSLEAGLHLFFLPSPIISLFFFCYSSHTNLPCAQPCFSSSSPQSFSL